MELDCGAMNPASLFHYAAVQVTPGRMTAVRMAIRDQYPTLPVITSRDIAEMLAVLSSDAGHVGSQGTIGRQRKGHDAES